MANAQRVNGFGGVDALPATHYLKSSMLRRLLACLALITGLAAGGAPAHANIVDSLASTLELTQRADKATKGEACTCADRQRQQRLRGERVTPCKPSESVTIVIPTVMMGVDRAYE